MHNFPVVIPGQVFQDIERHYDTNLDQSTVQISFSPDTIMSVLQQSLLLLLSLLFSRGLAGYSNTTLACGALYSTLPGQVAFPGSQGYENSISTYAYLGTRLRPTCLVSPKSTADVTAVIKALGEFDSVAFAIRGGGHNTNKGIHIYEWALHYPLKL
jgi:hypothetical protein